MLKTKSNVRRSMMTAGVTLALVAGTVGPAMAASVHSSMVDFWPGSRGTARTGTTATHTFDFLTTCYWNGAGSATPTYGQMQLQRQSGIGVVSLGNNNVSCSGGAASWGTQTSGQKYQYQYNGAAVSGLSGLQSGPFSVSDILISY